MTLLAGLIEKARAQRRTIVLPEGEDARILAAAAKAVSTGIATIKLLGKPEHIQRTARERHISLDGLEIIDPATDSDRRQACVHTLQTLRRDKTGRDMPHERALHKACQPLTFAHLMLRTGDADGCVAGAVHTTQRVISSALKMIGQHADSKLVSSFFLMQHSLPHQAIRGIALYADCALVIDPDAEQLATIAMDTANTARQLLGLTPTVALLSFSTAGSASHASIDKIKQAGRIIARTEPQLALLTEVQFDAAVRPDILHAKAPNLGAHAPANIFIFPDLYAGNIGYKIAQHIGGVKAVGPILQGLRQPVNDLSRGCSMADIYDLIAVTAVQAQINR